MNKHIYKLLLTTPLLFSACNSTTVRTTTPPSPIEEKIEVVNEATVSITEPAPTISPINYENDNKEIMNLGKLHIKSYLNTMQPTLKGLMQSDPSHKTALGACTTLGQSITNDYNRLSEVKIRRTALKYRNPLNSPDSTDKMVMERFLASNDFSRPLVINMGENNYRVYKALPTKHACLACHGQHISSDLKETLVKKYPTDMAIDFKQGELRGVVVAEITK